MKGLISFLLLLGTFSSIFGLNLPNPVNEQSKNTRHNIVSMDMGQTLNHLISSVQPVNHLPLSATFFFPTDIGMKFVMEQWQKDPSIILYHMLPRALSSCELRRNFASGSLIPTVLPGNSIMVTSNTIWNFTINGSPISHPDMFNTPSLVVHGVPTMLNYTRIGGSDSLPPQQQPKNGNGVAPSLPPLVPPAKDTGVASPPPLQPKNANGVASPPRLVMPPPKTASSPSGSSNQSSVAPGLFVQFGMTACFAVAAFFLS